MSAPNTDSIDVEAYLIAVAESASVPPPWLDEVQRLSPDSTNEQRLAVYRSVRDSGWLSNEQAFYLVASLVEGITDAEAATSLREIDERMSALERDHGNEEGQPWTDGSAAADYDELAERYQDAWDDLFLRKLAASGEQPIAELYRTDPDAYTRRCDIGEEQFRAKLQIKPARSDDELVSVASFINTGEAELAKNAIESEGIHATLANANLVTWQWEYSNATGGVSVQVRRGDAQHAQALLAASREKNLGTRPSWICPSCSQRIAGEWDVCWRCGASRDGKINVMPTAQTADTKRTADPEAAQQTLLKILAVSVIAIFVLMSIGGMELQSALIGAGVGGSLIYLVARFASLALPNDKNLHALDAPPAPDPDDDLANSGAQTKSEVSKAIVRRAWQASVLGAFGFPPLGFYALSLLWKLAGRETPLGAADRWRVVLAYVLSIIAVLWSLLFVTGIVIAFVRSFGRPY